MTKRTIIPSEIQQASIQLKMSPGIAANGFVFLTGVTGSDLAGDMPKSQDNQMRNIFEKIGTVLREAGLSFAAVVEMTSYHVAS